jgi:hypothetical protein
MYTFNVIKKDSASPTAILTSNINGIQTVLKVWINDKTDESEALIYERNVYEKAILPIVTINSDMHLLKYIGGGSHTFKELGTLLNIVKPAAKSWRALYTIIACLKNNIPINFLNMEDAYDYYVNNYKSKILFWKDKTILNLNLETIALPLIQFNTLEDQVKTVNTTRMISYIEQLVIGINACYKNELVHNDLHDGNVMIQPNDNLLIFDWDRSFYKTPNPLLNIERCVDLCGYSQCNIYNNGGYAIDLYKVLYYILINRKDSLALLNIVFKIKNRILEPNLIKKIKNILIYSPFFQEKNCTFLQFPDSNMKEVMLNFGDIDEIMFNVFNVFNTPIVENKNGKLKHLFFWAIIVGIAVTLGYNVIPTFGMNKRKEYDEPVEEKKQNKKGTKVKKELYKPSMQVSTKINKLINLPDDKVTKQDLRDLRHLVMEAKYGPVIDAENLYTIDKSKNNLPMTNTAIQIVKNEQDDFSPKKCRQY